MIILLHSSKAMRKPLAEAPLLRQPQLIAQARHINDSLKALNDQQLAHLMHLSPTLAIKTQSLIAEWNVESGRQMMAIDAFMGDIYSGLQAATLSAADRDYADQTLRILSGLYGCLRPYDGIFPYRLEMGYRLAVAEAKDLYAFWGRAVADCLSTEGPIINLAAIEYSRLVTAYVDTARLVTPKFLTIHPTTGQPTFVVVHTKIARGAFARWLITSRAQDVTKLCNFDDLGYHFDAELSSTAEPAFVCAQFGGKGLSTRLR